LTLIGICFQVFADGEKSEDNEAERRKNREQASFIIFDAMYFRNKSSMKQYGIHHITVVYEQDLLAYNQTTKTHHFSAPKAAKAAARVKTGPVMLDIESWETNLRREN